MLTVDLPLECSFPSRPVTPFLPADEAKIEFFTEEGGTALNSPDQKKIEDWIALVAKQRNGQLGQLNYIFCGDDYLHQMNVEYLNHDTLTDIITFPLSSPPHIAGDIFISTERVAENALELGLPYVEELHRVIIHGVLHLSGQGDKSTTEALEMRRLEDWALSLLR